MTEFGSDVHKLQNSKIKQKTIFEVIPNTQGMFQQVIFILQFSRMSSLTSLTNHLYGMKEKVILL
jgi:hypothetical protein